MGCRTLVAKNVNGEEGALKRGNIASISINLPKIARESTNLNNFYKKLNIPIIKNFKSGHVRPFITVPIGAKAKIDTYNRQIIIEKSTK